MDPARTLTFDWTISIGTVAMLLGQLVMLVGAYYGLKADNQRTAAKSEAWYKELASTMALQMLTERTDRVSASVTLKADLMALIAAMDAAVRDLTTRVGTLESGQDEWTKALRQRTHDLAEHINKLVLKIDRLERKPAS